MPSYDTFNPKGWCGDPSRGAALGRPTIEDGEPEGPITVCETHLDRDGYDRNGTYFGHGSSLFWYADESGNLDACERAAGVARMLEILSARYPGVTIIVGAAIQPKCYGHGNKPCEDGAEAQLDSEFCEECEWLACEDDQ